MTILNQIVASKRDEVDLARRHAPLERLKAQIADEPWAGRDFYGRLKTPGPGGVNIIAEVKRASPSKGLISADLDAGDCARAYEAGGAAAISVLTDTIYFKGRLADLRQARAAVQRPVLRKEFIISAYQVYESRAAGADALLLIARILEPGRLAELLALTHELGMAALVEIHSPQDYESAHGAGARLIGINNRNLATFDTDIRTAMDLAALLQADEIPVAASGISSRQDIEANLLSGIFNFLVGESLVRAENRAEQVSRLIRG
jgi:indole-3-glycerol phosphate synthase